MRAKVLANKTRLRFQMVVMLAFAALLLAPAAAGMALMPGKAYADAGVNYGNPFENGDIQPDDYGYGLNGVEYSAGGVTRVGQGPGPFAYPEGLAQYAESFKEAGGQTGLGDWGISDYEVHEMVLRSNTRNINISGLPSYIVGHCCQHDNPTVDATSNTWPREAYLYLYEQGSGWSADGKVYHAAFYLMVDNGHSYGVFDQAIIVSDLVYADWYLSGDLEVEKDPGSKYVGTGSLAGAVFQLKDSSGSVVASATTGKNGKAKFEGITPGTYTLHEKKAPEGFVKAEDKEVEVPAGETATYKVSEPSVRGGIIVGKKDRETGGYRQGNASLKGAEFTIYSRNSAKVTVAGEDYEKNDAVLTIATKYDNDYDAYVAKTKVNALPFGTYRVKETKAPKGYLLNTTWYQDIQITEDGELHGYKQGETLYPDEKFAVGDEVERGNLSLKKTDPDTTVEQGDASLAGAVFDIVNDSEGAVVSPQSGAEVQPGDVVCQVVTDANGKASTTNAALNGWSIPDDWDGKALAYGKYLVREAKAPEGYDLNETWTGSAVIAEDAVAPQVTLEMSDPVKRYGIAVAKYDRDTAASYPQGDAKMAGTKFSIVNDSGKPVKVGGKTYAVGSVVATIVAQKDDAYEGRYVAKTGEADLPYGTYSVKEVAAPEGYLNNEQWILQGVKLHGATSGAVADYTMHDKSVKDVVKRGNIVLEKDDSQRANGREQGDASFAGAVYDVINRSENAVLSPQYDTEIPAGGVVCKIVTDENGDASTTNASLNGWSIPDSWEGKALPYGTYEVKEASASTGYNVNWTWVDEAVIDADGKTVSMETTEDVQRGGLIVGKVTREMTRYIEQGAASLEGWEFEIVNKSSEPVILGRDATGPEVAPGEVVTTIATKKAGDRFIAETAVDALPFGTYEVHEIQTMRPQDNGYLFDEQSQAWSHVFTISDEGQIVDFTDEEDAVDNQVVRGDFAFSKKAAPSMKPLAKVPFKVTSVTTGEWHIVVTDGNGEVDTSSDNYEHTSGTNANDAVLKSDGSVDESKLNYESGVWFSGSKSIDVKPNDDRGALVFDTYMVEELPCKANEGLSLVQFEVTVSREGKIVSLGTIDDSKDVLAQVSTTLTDAEGSKLVAAKAGAVLVDVVTFNNLEKGEAYTLVAKLYKVQDGELGEQVGEATSQFRPSTSHGTEEVELEFDASELRGASLVCFEYLYGPDGSELATHEDPSDEGQTVTVPEIGTELTDDATGSHYATSKDEGVIALTDTVAYTGLTPKKTYTVRGTLMDKESGQPVIDAEGREVTAERSFTPSESEGRVELAFSFKDPGLAGRSLVAFEALEYRGVEYAVHADIDDDSQTVLIPRIGTTLTDTQTGMHSTSALGQIELVDTVAYDNLEPGRAYAMQATLRDKGSGQAVLDAQGESLTSRVEFVPEQSSGAVEVAFSVDAGSLPAAVVCFERLYAVDGTVAAVHEDIDSHEQTVYVPQIATQFTEASTGYHSLSATGNVELKDTVEYEGLEPGCTYTMSAVLVDKQTGERLLGPDGGELRSETTFVPEARDGSVEVHFALAAEDLAPATVCFERLLNATGSVVAMHEDIEDEGQTVYVPKIATTALDPRTKSRVMAGDGRLLLEDVVAYQGLEPGVEYRLTGEIHVRDDEGADAGVLKDADGGDVTAEVSLIPEAGEGSATVLFNAHVDDSAGKTFVVFEHLEVAANANREKGQGAAGDWAEVATHADISDEGQTVYVPKIGTLATDAATGTHHASSLGLVTVRDEVSYENLMPGIEYTMRGELHAKASDGTDAGPVKNAEGAEVSAVRSFVPEAENGSVDMLFEFDPALTAAEVVVFETLSMQAVVSDGPGTEGGEPKAAQVVAEHADISDEGQTVRIARIATTAHDARTGEHVAATSGKLEITDVVAYEGLEPNVEYRLSGSVHVRDAAGEDAGPLKDRSGKDVVASLAFKPSAPSGEVEMRFKSDAEVKPGSTLVVFESLSDSGGAVIATHEDIGDEGQTVTVPEIATTAVVDGSRSHYAASVEKFAVVDTVKYRMLQPGLEYVMVGSLHGVSEAGEDLGPVVDADGNEVTKTLTFYPQSDSGSVELEFVVDPSWMPSRAVAFETCGLMVNGKVIPVAQHENPRDEEQTVRMARIATTAVDKETGDHVGRAEKNAVVVDRVEYEGLEPGREYQVSGMLMDKGSATPFAVDGEVVTATATFTPEEANGAIEVEFPLENANLSGYDLVVFEQLSTAGKVVATHEDIDDAAQTVSYRKPGFDEAMKRLGNAFDKTGYWLAQHWWLVAVLGVALTALGTLLSRRRGSASVSKADDGRSGTAAK